MRFSYEKWLIVRMIYIRNESGNSLFPASGMNTRSSAFHQNKKI